MNNKTCANCVHKEVCGFASGGYLFVDSNAPETCVHFLEKSSVIHLPVSLNGSIYSVLGKNFVIEHKVQGAYYTQLENELVIIARSNDGHINALNKFHLRDLGKFWFLNKKEAKKQAKKGLP